MERWQGKVAVVTGASAGIGAAIASQLQDAGVTVVALARRKDRIQKAVEESRKAAGARGRTSIGKASKQGVLHCRQCDVSKEEDIKAAFKWIKDTLGVAHILVNNAGVGGDVLLAELNTEIAQRIFNTNVLGLSIATREAIQLMKEKGVDDGHIVHISSVAGHYSLNHPGTQIYSASKHAVRVLTEGLRKELVAAKSKIRVTEVSPGLVETEFITEESLKKSLSKQFGIDDPLKLYEISPHLKAEDVSDAVLYAISCPAHVQIHELIIRPIGENF